MAVAFCHSCDLEAERARLRAMSEYGKVRSRVRETKTGEKRYFYLDFHPKLRGGERFLSGIAGSSFKDESEAERIRQLISLDADRQGMTLRDAVARFRHPRARQNLVPTLASRWLEESRRRLQPNTLRAYQGSLSRYFGFWATRSIHEVTTANVRTWLTELQGRGLAETTVQHTVGCLKATVRRYQEDHPTFPTPVWPRLQARPLPQSPMPLADILEVMAHVYEDDLGIYLACLYTLCRPGEARAALIRDYDFREGRLTVCRALKTSSGRHPVSGPTKTGATGVYAAPPELREWIEHHRVEDRLRPDAPLFPNPRTGHHWEEGKLRRCWLAACERAGVPHVPMYRALKHSPGTALIEAGLSREDLQAAYRHRSQRTTMIYELEDRQRRDRATQALSELLGTAVNSSSTTEAEQSSEPAGTECSETGKR